MSTIPPAGRSFYFADMYAGRGTLCYIQSNGYRVARYTYAEVYILDTDNVRIVYLN